jgi:hypothetical protein
MGDVVSALALRQLAAWEHLAEKWPVYTAEAGYIRCAHDDLTVWRAEDNQGNHYTITDDEILALRVAHLRNHHQNLDPCEEIT